MNKLNFFSVIFFLTLGFTGFSQVPTVAQDSIINTLVDQYTDKLVLTGKQEVIFKENLQEYYLEKESIRKEKHGEAMLKSLYELGQIENGDMQEVLTAEQYEYYIRLKPSLQPLEELSIRNKS